MSWFTFERSVYVRIPEHVIESEIANNATTTSNELTAVINNMSNTTASPACLPACLKMSIREINNMLDNKEGWLSKIINLFSSKSRSEAISKIHRHIYSNSQYIDSDDSKSTKAMLHFANKVQRYEEFVNLVKTSKNKSFTTVIKKHDNPQDGSVVHTAQLLLNKKVVNKVVFKEEKASCNKVSNLEKVFIGASGRNQEVVSS